MALNVVGMALNVVGMALYVVGMALNVARPISPKGGCVAFTTPRPGEIPFECDAPTLAKGMVGHIQWTITRGKAFGMWIHPCLSLIGRRGAEQGHPACRCGTKKGF
jgi:hypothetical protein